MAVADAQNSGGGLHFPFTAFTGGGIPSYKGLAQILAQDGCVCAYLRNSFPPGCVEYVGRGSSNVYVELAIGLLVLRGLKQSEGLTQPRRAAGMAAVIGGGCLAAVFLKADYDMDGILIISLFYLLREKRIVQVMSGGILSLLESWNMCYGAGILSAVPLYFLQWKKGTGSMEIRLLLVLPAAFNGTVFHTAVCGRNSSRIIPGHAGLKRTKLFWFAQGFIRQTHYKKRCMRFIWLRQNIMRFIWRSGKRWRMGPTGSRNCCPQKIPW